MSTLTHDVSIWSIRNRNAKRKGQAAPKRQWSKPYELRWRVGFKPQSQSFLTRALADHFRADLLKAAQRGELFDPETGLPESMLATEIPDSRRWFEFAAAYVKLRWPAAAANTRRSIVDSLAVATLGLLDGEAVDLDRRVIRVAMTWALVPRPEDQDVSEETRLAQFAGRHRDIDPRSLQAALRLLPKATRRMSELNESEVVRSLLHELAINLDGKAAAADTQSHRRRAVNTALEYAVEVGDIADNPLQRKEHKRKKVARDPAIDRRTVVNPKQAREFLTAVSYVGSWKRARGRRLVAFFATMYFAAPRPAEAVFLRRPDCELPHDGWGTLYFQETRPESAKQWTDSGHRHDERGLKQRERGDVRPVPIPPELVAILRAHIKEFGTAEDGRLFANERGGLIGSSTINRVFKEARELAFMPHQVASPLAETPYDLRHAALSTWLNAGVDATDVAKRAGNSVEVLLKIYAKCLDGQEDRNNTLIERALADRPLTGDVDASVTPYSDNSEHEKGDLS
ncbi:tyrosine-type recombinase/integrase [Nocardioides speluncae]|uniref:tyrosine-type recombinase/integrase n=1 Tax=Nocardioides speluncae TaxID=2670337 RepID=UPI000D69D1EC|nr:tyrosine-type recombinase/integrase [Nocardioides speluncae]